jgi:hypothetical protein
MVTSADIILVGLQRVVMLDLGYIQLKRQPCNCSAGDTGKGLIVSGVSRKKQ